MLFIDCDLLAEVRLFAFNLVVEFNHKEEPSTVAPDIIRVDPVVVDQVLADT